MLGVRLMNVIFGRPGAKEKGREGRTGRNSGWVNRSLGESAMGNGLNISDVDKDAW